MMHFKKRETEDLAYFMERTNRSITGVMKHHGVVTWDVLARRNIFKWAGWVARLAHFDPERITLDILHLKNWNWICNIASQNNGNQLHCRKLHTWRWEKLIYSYFDENFPLQSWHEIAQDAQGWEAIVDNVG